MINCVSASKGDPTALHGAFGDFGAFAPQLVADLSRAVAVVVLMQLLPAGWLAAPLAVRTLGGAIPAAETTLDRAGPGEQRGWRQAREIYGLYSDQLAVCAADTERSGKAVKCSVVVGMAK